MNAKPISETSKPSLGQTGCLVVFGLIFFIAGLAVIVTQVVMPWLSAKAAASWPEVGCVILSSDVETHRGDTTTYSFEVEYEYEFAEQSFESSRYSFTTMSPSYRQCKALVERYPAGEPSTCFVDPEAPGNAVLDRTPVCAWTLLIFGFIFAGIGASIAFVLPAAMNRPKKLKRPIESPQRLSPAAAGQSPTDQMSQPGIYPEDLEDQKWDVPQRLKPSSTKIGSLVVIVLMGLFWNGIVSVFAWNAINNPMGGFFSIFMWLFLTPFILIGLLIALGAIKAFLSLFSPVVEIALSTGAIPRGSTVDVAWEVQGNASRIARLQIAVVGTEEAKYQQGTDTVTATSNFGKIEILDTCEPEAIAFGSCPISIPADTMHTFADQHNKITWAIQVRGEINRWPDVFQTHIFRVKP